MTLIAAGDIAIDGGGLDATRARAILAARAAAHPGPATASTAETLPVLLCEIGGERFGLPLADIRQIVTRARVSRVPDAPPALLGVFARGGRIHTLFTPAALLGTAADGEGGHMLLLRGDAPRIALAVDRALAIVALPAADAPAGDRLATPIITADEPRFALIATPLLIAALRTPDPSRRG